jgi:hypothetical protein
MAIFPIDVAAVSAPAGAAATHLPSKASFGSVLRAQASPSVASPPARQMARAALEAVERARQRLDTALAAARRGQTFTAQELLALQADAYRFSQTVEVASKVVEQGAQSVKQAVNTQV